jgi:hemoglobin-like flavoprotein/anti-anti-sigma regulatory factor
MAREKKSMIGFDPLAWLDEEKQSDSSAEESGSVAKKKAPAKSRKQAEKWITVLGRSIDETALIKGYELAVGKMDDVVADFYSELFLQYPNIQTLFENTSDDVQSVKLAAQLKLLMDNLHNDEVLKTALGLLGEKHQGYGALTEHYSVLTKLLVNSLKSKTGRSWTRAVGVAWSSLLDAASETMCAAYTTDAAVEETCSETNESITEEPPVNDQSVEEEVESGNPVLHLNSIQDISKSQALKNDMMLLINDSDEIDIEASEVERIDGTALQLLCALFNYSQQNNLVINWLNPSEVLLQSAQTLGLHKVLELN